MVAMVGTTLPQPLPSDNMPYSCESPYDRQTATTQDRIKSCTRTTSGPYSDRQPCVTECYVGGPGRDKTLSAAAKHKRKAKRTGGPPGGSKRRKTNKKTGCPAKSRSDCTSPCKWASGTKRSFCRTGRNRQQIDEGVFIKRPPKTKTGCPAKSRSDCTSPCKWATGTKRSFCRKATNSKK